MPEVPQLMVPEASARDKIRLEDQLQGVAHQKVNRRVDIGRAVADQGVRGPEIGPRIVEELHAKDAERYPHGMRYSMVLDARNAGWASV